MDEILIRVRREEAEIFEVIITAFSFHSRDQFDKSCEKNEGRLNEKKLFLCGEYFVKKERFPRQQFIIFTFPSI
jgi:hypothetical protein